MASLRSSAANEASRMARLPGVSRAPPTPWRTRVTISWPDPVATRAGRRGQGEPRHPDHEDPLPPETVAQRTAEEEERGQGQGVAGDHPLQRSQRGVEVSADGREGDPDDGGVHRRHSRAEHGGGDHPAPARGVGAERRPCPRRRPSVPTRDSPRHRSTNCRSGDAAGGLPYRAGRSVSETNGQGRLPLGIRSSVPHWSSTLSWTTSPVASTIRPPPT